MDGDTERRHNRGELMTTGERIELLEHSVGVLQDRVEALRQVMDSVWTPKGCDQKGAAVWTWP